MEICNACRYCEGFCAVFPAMELRREFSNGDLTYLANLCHNCRGCYYACQYAPPHPFGVNVPKAFAELRTESYAAYAWPRPLAALFQRNGLIVSLATAIGIAVVLILTMLLKPADMLYGSHAGPGAFYAVIPWGVLVLFAGVTFVFSIVALVMGGVNFWRDTASGADRQRPHDRGGATRRADAALSRRRGAWLQRSRRAVHADAALLASLHVLRVFALLRRDLRSDVLRRHSRP